MTYISNETIETIRALGFDVWLPSEKTTYLYYSDSKDIAYLQIARFGGFETSTCHIPNRQCGTGFQISDNAQLTRESLAEAFCFAPRWANTTDRASVVKWPSPEKFADKNWQTLTKMERIAQEESGK